MQVTKVITSSIDISDPIGVMSNPDDNIMYILRSIFEGRCYSSCHILTINRIIRRSKCMINHDGLIGQGSISVVFEVTGYEFPKGEVLVGCDVVGRDADGLIICKWKDITVLVTKDTKLDSITVGQKIPVIVGGGALYSIGQSASVGAVHYRPLNQGWFKMSNDGFRLEEQQELLAEIMAKITEEEKLAESLADTQKAFRMLLTTSQDTNSDSVKTIPLSNLLDVINKHKNGELYISRDMVDKHKSGVNISTTKRDYRSEFTTSAGIIAVFYHYYNSLRVLREFTETYPTPDSITKHRNVVKIISEYNPLIKQAQAAQSTPQIATTVKK